jgi:predicted alpha/beta-fold hydrolase
MISGAVLSKFYQLAGRNLAQIFEIRRVKLQGHGWTIYRRLQSILKPPPEPPSVPWGIRVPEARFGEVGISGRLNSAESGNRLLIVLHGLAGCAGSEYSVRTAAAAQCAGWACLRLNARGADRSGEDIYHAGLTTDLPLILASNELRRFATVAILGYSLGGHLALRYATETMDSRLRAVVAVCPPLDLKACVAEIDRASLKPYRAYLLHYLRECYLQVVKRRRHVSPYGAVRQTKTLRAWDTATVVPRFGFASADDYYERMSVGPILQSLRIPSLVIATEQDPMVPAASLKAHLEVTNDNPQVLWTEWGGHVAFPVDFRMGVGGEPGLAEQSIRWIEQHVGS